MKKRGLDINSFDRSNPTNISMMTNMNSRHATQLLICLRQNQDIRSKTLTLKQNVAVKVTRVRYRLK